MLLLGGAVEHDVALFGGQFGKRHIGAHAHGAAHLFHEVPHQRAPHHHGAFVDGLAFVGDQRGAVDRAGNARSAAGGAGSFAVEGKLLGARSEKLGAAVGAGGWQLGRHVKGGWDVLAAVGAHVAAYAREQKAKAVQKLA